MSETAQRIFVNIASYRDPDCQWTLRDLFDKADDPERVFAGVCWQFIPGEDDDCFQHKARPEQCRTIEFHATESRGVGWARHKAQSLWDGEEFTLQIDSHMRFVAGWDRKLVAMLGECPSPRAVLSTYPVAFEPPDNLAPDNIVTILPKDFDGNRILTFRSVARSPKRAPSVPQPSAFCAAGFLFAPAAIIEEVPYDPYIYFQGEEITLAARLWTHGWDIFSPHRVIAYHDYANRSGRTRHWKDDPNWGRLNGRSVARVRHLLGIDISGHPEVIEDMNLYGLGSVRRLQDYEAFSGISFRHQTIDGKPAQRKTVTRSSKDPDGRRDVFTRIWEQNGWGAEETRSGDGSTLKKTVTLREQLPGLMERLSIRSLADAGCGDLNWMAEIVGDLERYSGFDIVAQLVDELRETFADRPNFHFAVADVVTDILPRHDAILVRDCLTHLPADQALAALARFKASRSTYLIATTHPKGTNKKIRTGAWCAYNLTTPPFGLPPPEVSIDEGLPGWTKTLGVWRLAELP